MQIHAQKLIGFSLLTADGEIGKIKDIYFDDQAWTVRYLVIETGNWLIQRKVLISPLAVEAVLTTDSKALQVSLNKKQVKNSPDIDTNMPVSRQQESSLFDHYSWPSFGRAGMGWPTTGMVKGASALLNQAELEQDFDPHLRSFHHVAQYEVHNQGGRVGLVKDMVLDLSNWSVSYLLIDDVFTSDKERVVVALMAVSSIDWSTSQVKVSYSDEELQKAPIINAEGFFSGDLDT